jgi:carboxymethylenebutenolidase
MNLSPSEQKLNDLWDEHCRYEFVEHNVEATMGTMVDNPYVNHIPTMTGGTGKKALAEFYQHHFVSCLPADTKMIPVSRTVGQTRLVEEMIFCFTHDREIDFLLPGVPPTFKKVEIPLVAIITFENDKIANEHIYWDQASVLKQIGLLKSDDLPICGIEQTAKLQNKHLPSHQFLQKF